MNRRSHLGSWVVIVLVACGISGCASGGGSGRGDVSGAMEAAADDEDENRRGDGRTRTKNDTGSAAAHDDDHDDADDGGLFGFAGQLFFGGESEGQRTNAAGSDTDAAILEFLPAKNRNLSLWLSSAHPAGDTIEKHMLWTLMYSKGPDRRLRTHIGLYYGTADIGTQPTVREGVRRIGEGGLDLGLRAYATPDHTLMGLYLLSGARVGVLGWSYVNPVAATTDVGGIEWISDDGVFMVTPYVGCGWTLLQAGNFHIGLSGTWGYRIAIGQTLEEFRNDIFRDVGEFKLNLETSLYF